MRRKLLCLFWCGFLLGLIAGFIGSKLVNKTGEGVLLDIVLGIVGAIVGGYMFQHLWSTRRDRTKHLQSNRSCDRLGCGAGNLSRHQRKRSTSLTTERPFVLRTPEGVLRRHCGGIGLEPNRVYTLMILDVRTARVVVTLLAFGVSGALLYTARKTLVLILFAILFAYLLDPAVTSVQRSLASFETKTYLGYCTSLCRTGHCAGRSLSMDREPVSFAG